MKNNFKKIAASVMAITSLVMGVTGINVSAANTNDMENTEVTMSENSARSSCAFSLSDKNEHYLTSKSGAATVTYTATANQGGVTIVVRSSSGNFVESHYFSAGYAPSFSVYVPSGESYKFYAKSSTASSGNVISGTAYIY